MGRYDASPSSGFGRGFMVGRKAGLGLGASAAALGGSGGAAGAAGFIVGRKAGFGL